MASPSPDAADLRALADKYRTLLGLRAQRDEGASQVSRATLRALAERHPGCLRELDTLGPVEIERRAEAAAAAAAGAPREPWMAWIWAYHRLMRATLATKRAIGRGRPREDQIQPLAAAAREIAGFALGGDFVVTVATPPQRRLGVVVMQLLGEMFAAPPAVIAETLFPLRRPAPYALERG